jgi:hypothetical protein
MLPRMQLVQIGQTPLQTLQEMIEDMAAQQSAEITQLKQAALERYAAAQLRRRTASRFGDRRQLCATSSNHRSRNAA